MIEGLERSVTQYVTSSDISGDVAYESKAQSVPHDDTNPVTDETLRKT